MWGSSHSHLSVICFLKSCAVTLTNQPVGLFRCCVSSEETESYALPKQPSTPTPQIISTNPQNSCFKRDFDFKQFQSHRRTAYKRPVTTTATKQKSTKKVRTKPKSEAIHHKIHKNHSPTQYFCSSTIKHHQANPFKQPSIHFNHPNPKQANTQ